MRTLAVLFLSLIALCPLKTPAHVGTPPQLPDIDDTAPASISASTTNCNVVGTSWCAYGVGGVLRCKKNGTAVTLSFNSITTNWPHTYHLDKTWNVNLTPLNLVAGDVLVWEFVCWATSGPNAGQRIAEYATTQVQ